MINQTKVKDSLNIWSEYVIKIGELNKNPEEQRKFTLKAIKELYAYGIYDVLFTPTKASKKAFRPTLEGAVSYFIGNNKNYPEDNGFAKYPWKKIRFDYQSIQIINNVAFTMGNYYFTDLENAELKAEFSFVFVEDDNDSLKIVLHHSSLPFNHPK